MRLEGPVAQAQEWGILKKGGSRGELHPLPLQRKSKPEGLVIQYDPDDLLKPQPRYTDCSAVTPKGHSQTEGAPLSSSKDVSQRRGPGVGVGEVFRLFETLIE